MPAATGSVYRRLYRGETNIDFVGQRKKWYLASGILIAICVLAMVFRGFLFGIEFSGGDQYQIPLKPGTTLAQLRTPVETTGVARSSAPLAGAHSIVHFEVTPGTVVGLLSILGYSLYDTVVVFDKVDENTRGLLGSTRHTYAEAANLAVNQTLMRSINTSLIGLLPVAGLLFVGAGLLGVGTLQDLALVLFVGMITGAYSSLFLATPWLVDFKLFDPRYRNQAQRALTKRTADAARAAAKPGARVAAATSSEDEAAADDDDLQPRVDELATSAAPRVGAKPAGGRPTGAKRTPAGRATGRPAGGKRRH